MLPKIDIDTASAMAKSTAYVVAATVVALIATMGVIVLLGAAASAANPFIAAVCVVGVAGIAWHANLLAMTLFKRSEECL